MPLPDNALAWNVAIDPLGVAVNRTELDICNPLTGIQIGGTSSGAGIDWGTSALTQMMSQEGRWGSAPADFIAPNRTITIPLGLGMGGPGTPDANSALSTLAQKVGLLQREGGWLLRQREGGQPLYADIVDAQLDVPDTWGETGDVEPGVTLTLVCLPDFYGNEVALDSIPCTGYCEAVLTSGGTQAVIEGDYPARCRLVATDNSGNDQASIIWGVRSRYYDSNGDATLAYQATSFSPIGAASRQTLAGSYSSQVITSGTLTTGVLTEIAGLYNQAHIGTYAVWVRASPSSTSMRLQLQWYLASPSATAVNNSVELSSTSTGYQLVNLGVVTIPSLPTGISCWNALIYAQPGGSGQTISIDMAWLQPLSERAGFVPPPGGSTGAIFGNNTTQIRSEGLFRDGETHGVFGFYGPIVGYGDLPRLAPSGLEQRAVQVFVKPSRLVAGEAVTTTLTPDPGIDTFTVTPYYRPSFMFRP